MTPLAERLRPRTLDEYVGQQHLVGPDAPLRRMIESGHVSSFILWGPPGVGKTTLANIIARRLDVPFFTLSATAAGVKEVRETLDRAAKSKFFATQSPLLFIDEIHRFSKSQQDSLLNAVETGVVTVEYGHIASYAGEPLPGDWISDRDVYAPDATPTIGAQVVYKLANPYTIQLTPKQIAALSGVNTLYTDAGTLTVTGREDPRHTIVTLTDRIAALESAAAGV